MELYSERKYLIGAFIIVISVIFIGRLFSLQIMDPSYKLSASSNVVRNVTQYPSRGLIYDRNMELLVSNKPSYDLMVTPIQLTAFDTTELCDILEISREQLESSLKKAREYSRFRSSVFLKQLSAATYAVLQEKLYKYPGFYVQPRTLRNYHSDLAGHILGYVGEADEDYIRNNEGYAMGDYIGVTGIERTYENVLKGKKGVQSYLVNVHGQIMGPYQEGRFDTPATVGSDLVSTIDASLQEYGEILMENKRGSIVAIEPSTGEILSLVSSPSYDPSLLVGRQRSVNYRKLALDTLNPLFNRALMAHYPPGSAFKIINGLVALQENIVSPSEQLYCPGSYTVGTLTIRCRFHKSPVNLPEAIQYSCNTYFSDLFRKTLDHTQYGSVTNGFNTWRDHVTSFGLGDKLNSDFPNELRGNVPVSAYYDRFYGENRWRSLQVVSLGLGQAELTVTPLQMANMTAAIANRGFYYTPRIVKGIQNDSAIDEKFTIKNYTSIDSTWFEFVIEGMERVVNGPDGGTGRLAEIPSITVCGKTGTVQNPHGENHSVFVAFAPKDDPKIAISVYVENAGYGASWAAPIASLMIEKYLTDTVTRIWLENHILNADFITNEE